MYRYWFAVGLGHGLFLKFGFRKAIMINLCRLCGSIELQLLMTDGHNCDLNFYRGSVYPLELRS